MSIYISKAVIKGFKKFRDFEICFNNRTNILVGDNESGKTTIIQAIDLALNHSMKNFDNTLLANLFNRQNVSAFETDPRISTLPTILIQVFFEGMDRNPSFAKYYGPNYTGGSVGKERYGIEFSASLNHEFEASLSTQIANKHIPFEYYDLKTSTFGGKDYKPGIDNISFCFIDADSISGVNSYPKIMFKQLLTKDQQTDLKNVFSYEIEKAITETMKKLPPDSPVFKHDLQKSSLENLLSIYEDDIPLFMKGRGRENFMKIDLALRSKKSLTIIAIEEPENHLSHSTMNEMLDLINKHCENDVQMIITSHSSRIAGGLGLDNIIMLSRNNENVLSLKSLSILDTANYFKAIPSDNLLYFVLSKKVILVEGPSELIYMDKFCNIVSKKSLHELNATCIAVNGLSFKHFAEIGNVMKKKIAIITDNDNDLERVKKFKKDLIDTYDDKSLIDVFFDNDKDRSTFEISFYKDNASYVQSNLVLEETANYEHKYSGGDKYLGKMLNQKTNTALFFAGKDDFTNNIKVPTYIENALKFII